MQGGDSEHAGSRRWWVRAFRVVMASPGPHLAANVAVRMSCFQLPHQAVPNFPQTDASETNSTLHKHPQMFNRWLLFLWLAKCWAENSTNQFQQGYWQLQGYYVVVCGAWVVPFRDEICAGGCI